MVVWDGNSLVRRFISFQNDVATHLMNPAVVSAPA